MRENITQALAELNEHHDRKRAETNEIVYERLTARINAFFDNIYKTEIAMCSMEIARGLLGDVHRFEGSLPPPERKNYAEQINLLRNQLRRELD